MPTPTQDPTKVASDLATQAQALGVPGVSQYIQPSGTINSESLAPAPQFKLPETTPSATEAPAFGNYLEEYSKQFGVDDAQKGRDTSLQSYLGSLINTEGETALTSKAYEQGGVDTLNLELKDLNNQLLGEQRALQKELEAIEKNPEGLTLGAMQDKLGDARTASLRRQADIAVVQMAKQGQYDSAKTIADRAISAQLERQKQRNDILQFIYTENKSLFDKKEQRAFEAAQKERDRDLRLEEQNLKTISDLSLDALQNGAPSAIAAQMRSAKTVEEAMKVGGQYVGALDRTLKVAQLRKTQYEFDLLQKYGGMSPAEYRAYLKEEKKEIEAQKDVQEKARLQGIALGEKIGIIDSVLASPALDSVVGPTPFSRSVSRTAGFFPKTLGVIGGAGILGLADEFTGADDVVASIEQLISKEFLDNLIDTKAQGATFGALTKPEQDALTAAALRIGQTRIRLGNEENGKVIGYDMSQSGFVQDFKTVRELTRKAYEKSTGQSWTEDENALWSELEAAASTPAFNPSF